MPLVAFLGEFISGTIVALKSSNAGLVEQFSYIHFSHYGRNKPIIKKFNDSRDDRTSGGSFHEIKNKICFDDES